MYLGESVPACPELLRSSFNEGMIERVSTCPKQSRLKVKRQHHQPKSKAHRFNPESDSILTVSRRRNGVATEEPITNNRNQFEKGRSHETSEIQIYRCAGSHIVRWRGIKGAAEL
jgi:hypothetical protein